eukprot:scaffold31522_cov32-Prasinocladus_malaysianus.AAC.1
MQGGPIHRVSGAAPPGRPVPRRRRRRQPGPPLQPRGAVDGVNAQRGGQPDALQRLQPVAAQHVPVPDGQADHGDARAGPRPPDGHKAVQDTDAADAARPDGQIRRLPHGRIPLGDQRNRRGPRVHRVRGPHLINQPRHI